jgi:bifunctional ADP-heptose synthase (sugar kinase/adenylyltransferase)/phosphoglycolate phosphatase-like HAD superfamily hydrolase
MLGCIGDVSLAVVGDFCLDVYWFVGALEVEPSVETGLAPKPVERQRTSLGGAGNVVANVAAMGCRRVDVYGMVGQDPWGHETVRLLGELGVDTTNMLAGKPGWATLTYVKPHVDEREECRYDFGNFNTPDDATAEKVLARLERNLAQYQIVIVNQQVREGLHTPFFRMRLAAIMERHPETRFIIDSRHHGDSYPAAILKVNEGEAVRLAGLAQDYPTGRQPLPLVEQAMQTLVQRRGRPVFVTRGSRGCFVSEGETIHEIPGIQVMGPTDPVGAGDTMLAGIALASAAGHSPVEAAALGNLAAWITAQKLRQTGTASPDELLAAGRDPDFVFRPELAEDERQARLMAGTEFEIADRAKPPKPVKFAIFDHDGTISTLRQGWEKVMEPVMVKAILGSRYATVSEGLFQKVVERARDYIDRSTGIQTLIQMQALVRMVEEFGCVPAKEILDPAGYKRVYNDALMEVVRARVAKLRRGDLCVEDFTMKNAVPLLRALAGKGVRMYLASGTDEDDVVREAQELGYADLFTGGIHGATGDVTREAKKIVLDRILEDIGPAAMDSVVTFGDGPVEMRETRRRGGFAVGIASDEVQRFGVNRDKRARLIKAGADLVIPDFSQLQNLLSLLS